MDKTEMMPLLLSLIERTSDTQARAALNRDAIDEYRRWLEEGRIETVPPIDVWFDGATYHIGDGWHRYEAHVEADFESIVCRIHKGSERDARMHACGANKGHGVRRTQADRRRAIEIMLADSEWSDKSSRMIADHCGVDHKTVEKIRQENADGSGELPQSRVGSDGRKLPPKPRAKQEPTEKAVTSNGSATATAEKPKPGREKVAVEKRKEARKAFGLVVRFVDTHGGDEAQTLLGQVADLMKPVWG